VVFLLYCPHACLRRMSHPSLSPVKVMKKTLTLIISAIAAISLFAGCELETSNTPISQGAETVTEGNEDVNWEVDGNTGVVRDPAVVEQQIADANNAANGFSFGVPSN